MFGTGRGVATVYAKTTVYATDTHMRTDSN